MYYILGVCVFENIYIGICHLIMKVNVYERIHYCFPSIYLDGKTIFHQLFKTYVLDNQQKMLELLQLDPIANYYSQWNQK